jgi:hypothetical protein
MTNKIGGGKFSILKKESGVIAIKSLLPGAGDKTTQDTIHQ